MLSKDVIACAKIVEGADPERFKAVMATPISARAPLFPLYAFNVEVTRAPWVTNEPMIAAMRLQWWRDALAEIAAGGLVRRHEVVVPLAGVLRAEDTELLDELVVARHWDIERTPFGNVQEALKYIDATNGTLLRVAGRLMQRGADDATTQAGRAFGIAAFLRALPELNKRGRDPLPKGNDSIKELADTGLAALARAYPVPRAVKPAYTALWQTRDLLNQAASNPSCVRAGDLSASNFKSWIALLRLSMGWRA